MTTMKIIVSEQGGGGKRKLKKLNICDAKYNGRTLLAFWAAITRCQVTLRFLPTNIPTSFSSQENSVSQVPDVHVDQNVLGV